MAPPMTCRAPSTPPAANSRKTSPRRRPTARSIRRIRRSCCCRQLPRPCRSPPSATPSTLSSPSRSARSPAWRKSSSAVSRSRRSGSRSTRQSWWPRACRWRTSATRSRSRRSTAPKATSTARPAPTRSTPTTSCWIRRTGTTSSSPTATAARCGVARSAGPEAPKRAAWATGKRGVFLVVFKQPGANVIDTVDKIKSLLPRLVAAIPPAIQIEVISDRTQTIRAAVADVQFTLLLTIALVVMVIFVSLRSFWATMIPTVTVPLALLGACALMWVFGYTLDNLSLMALTIAVGFVVDDAIVMLENITRYIEEGEKPLAAAFKGAREIGFTIVSISISLVAVLIPLLLMGGIIGRLFREFAVTLAMTIFVSMVVSLTLTPMMASRFLRAHGETRHGRFYQWSERAFDAMLHAYERGLDRAMRWSKLTLLVFFATLALSIYLFVVIPKGFFPQQDNGLITATAEAGQDISFAAMKQRQEELGKIVMEDPDVAQSTQGVRPADHLSPASQARKGRGRAPLHAGGARRAARRPADADAVR